MSIIDISSRSTAAPGARRAASCRPHLPIVIVLIVIIVRLILVIIATLILAVV